MSFAKPFPTSLDRLTMVWYYDRVRQKLMRKGMESMKLIVISLLLAVAPLFSPGIVRFADAQDSICLPSSELSLSGIMLGDSEKKIKQRLGKPRKVLKETQEDADGTFILTTYHYPDLNIDIARDRVSRLFTTSPSTMTPKGIKTGMTYDETADLLGMEKTTADQSKRVVSFIRTCPDQDHTGSGRMKLLFNENRVLSSIEIRTGR